MLEEGGPPAAEPPGMSGSPLTQPAGPEEHPPDGPARDETGPDETGRRPERYHLGEMLGRGGAAVVHRGWDRRLHRPVALKLLADDAPAAAGREARLAAGLDHPGLVPVYDVSELGGQEAVVMPLVEGPCLSDRLGESGPMSVAETLDLGAQLAAGLAHVHARGVVHRDVKPGNVLLGPRGPRLTDFGIARVPGTTTITGDGMVLGTAAYLAPEQIRGDEVGPATDVFSLGLLLVECLRGTPCYPTDPASCGERVDTVPDLPAAPDLPRGLDRELGALLRDLTRLDPGGRPSAATAAVRMTGLRDRVLAPAGARAGAPGARFAAAGVRTREASDAATRALRGSAGRALTWARTPAGRRGAITAGLVLLLVVIVPALLLGGRVDVAVPLLVAALAAQGAVLCFGRARRLRPGTDDPLRREPRHEPLRREPRHEPRPPAAAGP